MKIFFDCEFTGLTKDTSLISIGMIAENGLKFYAEFDDYKRSQVDEWIKENVMKNLWLKSVASYSGITKLDKTLQISYGSKEWVIMALDKYLNQFEKIEIIGDCLAFDWVLFCDIYGHAFNIPKHVYYIPFDICTIFKMKGIDPDISREEFVKDKIEKGTDLYNNGM
jgi:hypothetical protein